MNAPAHPFTRESLPRRDAGSVLPPDSRAGDTSSVLADLNRAKCVFQLRGVVAAMGFRSGDPVIVDRNGKSEMRMFIDIPAGGHLLGHPTATEKE